jgi:hypothetical protein
MLSLKFHYKLSLEPIQQPIPRWPAPRIVPVVSMTDAADGKKNHASTRPFIAPKGADRYVGVCSCVSSGHYLATMVPALLYREQGCPVRVTPIQRPRPGLRRLDRMPWRFNFRLSAEAFNPLPLPGHQRSGNRTPMDDPASDHDRD